MISVQFAVQMYFPNTSKMNPNEPSHIQQGVLQADIANIILLKSNPSTSTSAGS